MIEKNKGSINISKYDSYMQPKHSLTIKCVFLGLWKASIKYQVQKLVPALFDIFEVLKVSQEILGKKVTVITVINFKKKTVQDSLKAEPNLIFLKERGKVNSNSQIPFQKT